MSAPPCSCTHAIYCHGTRSTDAPDCFVKGCSCAGYDGEVHVLLPNMSFACGGNMLTKVGASTCGTGDWARVSCPDCLALGREYLRAVVRWQQGHGEHPDDIRVAPEHHAVTVGEQMDLFGALT